MGPAVVLEMGSADSAGNARGPSCGLVRSLLPNSCRGSAEAFARCLHRRLTSLGNEDGADERAAGISKPHETSWLRPSSSARHLSTANNFIAGGTNHVLQSQPRHSPESDLFYDVELDHEEDEEEEEEMMEDGGGSPAEEATAAELARLLVNCPDILKAGHHEGCHCSLSGSITKTAINMHHDSETSCVFVSPITGTPPDSDSSEVFFDPESSDTERLKPEQYFDPVSTSDSETTSNATDASARPKATLNRHERTEEEASGYRCEEVSSESSCSLPRRNPAIRENVRRRDGEQICSSEENSELNGRSSQETTTSPSHESLWSTFDDSTISLQDDSPSKISRDSVIPRIYLPKSHSDSELPSNGIIAETVSDILNTRNEDDKVEEDEQSVDEVDFVSNGPVDASQIVDGNLMKNNRFCNHSENLFRQKMEVEKDLNFKLENMSSHNSLHNSLQVEVEDTITDDSDTDRSAYDSAIDIPDVLESSSGVTTSEVNNDEVKNNGTNDETNDLANNEANLRIDALKNREEEKKLSLLLKKLGGDSAVTEEQDTSPEQECQSGETVEEEEDRPQRVRRCSSLKTGKTPPGTPRRKKIVRFADKLGLDLADVRTFLDEIPRIPNSAYNDLIYDDAAFRHQDNGPECVGSTDWCERRCSYQEDMIRRRSSSSSLPRKIERMLVPLFQQPGGMGNFLDMVRERRVCLENVLVQDPVTLAIQGTVRVINIDFHKSVHIRYTLNAWRNYSDLQATYVPNSCDGFSDKFSFILYCHTLAVGQRLEFAVRFQCKGVQYWDNNTGANYCFQCLPASSPTGYIPITADENRRSSWSPVFY